MASSSQESVHPSTSGRYAALEAAADPNLARHLTFDREGPWVPSLEFRTVLGWEVRNALSSIKGDSAGTRNIMLAACEQLIPTADARQVLWVVQILSVLGLVQMVVPE